MNALVWLLRIAIALAVGTVAMVPALMLVGALWPGLAPMALFGGAACVAGVGFAAARLAGRPVSSAVVDGAAAFLVGGLTTLGMVGYVTKWHFARWEETICSGTGDLACDVGLIYQPFWGEATIAGVIAASLFLVGIGIGVAARERGSIGRRNTAGA